MSPEIASLVRTVEQAVHELKDLERQKNGAYAERNKCVAALARLALKLGWRTGVGLHDPNDPGWEPDWRTILFIDTPAGQCSWHYHDSEVYLLAGLPNYPGSWDGHSTAEKYSRLERVLS
jgi:hypothetical protein